MAARRLIIVMVILLGISTLLAAALPDRIRDAEDEQTTSEASTAAETETGTEAKPAAADLESNEPCKKILKCFQLDADLEKVQVIPLRAGDQLSLTVQSSKDDLVEILKLGFIDVVGPGNPATFDILADRPGTYGIRLVEAARTMGRIEVQQGSAAKPAESPE